VGDQGERNRGMKINEDATGQLWGGPQGLAWAEKDEKGGTHNVRGWGAIKKEPETVSGKKGTCTL